MQEIAACQKVVSASLEMKPTTSRKTVENKRAVFDDRWKVGGEEAEGKKEAVRGGAEDSADSKNIGEKCGKAFSKLSNRLWILSRMWLIRFDCDVSVPCRDVIGR